MPDRKFPPQRELVAGVLCVADVDRLQIADGAASHRGERRSGTSVHGTLTGRGADLIVLDDPQKPDETLSEAHRKGVGKRVAGVI